MVEVVGYFDSSNDFLAGFLGLFLGFSVVSIAELVYFAFVRPWCSTRRISNEAFTHTLKKKPEESSQYRGNTFIIGHC